MDALRGTLLPSTTFIFRGKDAFGGTIERPYTPVKCYARDAVTSDRDLMCSSIDGTTGTLPTAYTAGSIRKEGPKELIYEFFVNLIPDGLMSTFLQTKKKGGHVMIQGPLANEMVIDKIHDDQKQKREVILIAAGTGIAPMLQMVDHFLDERETSGLEPPTARNATKPQVFLCWIVYCPSLSFEGAAGLRERSKRFSSSFRYFVVYAHDSTARLLDKKTPFPDGGPAKVSNRRMSLTKMASAPGETPKTAGRRMSLTRGTVSLQQVETGRRRKSFKAIALESDAHDEEEDQLPSKSQRMAPLSRNNELKPLSSRQRRASLTAMASNSSLRERRGSLTKNWSNAFSVSKPPAVAKSKPVNSDYDPDDSSLFSDSDSDSDEGEFTTLAKSFDSPSARRQFQASFRAKGRFDKDLVAALLPMATGRHFDTPLYGEGGEENDEVLMRTRISITYRETLVAVCGRPQAR